MRKFLQDDSNNFNTEYYSDYSHITKTASWLPPAENWGPNIEEPFGWEKAITSSSENGQFYYIK